MKKFIWVKNQNRISDPHEPANLYVTQSSFKFGEMAYIDSKTGYAISCPLEYVQTESNPLGRVLFLGRNLTMSALIYNEFKLNDRLMKADGQPKNYAINYGLNRII